MMKSLVTACLLTGLAAQAGNPTEPQTVDAQVANALQNFQPFWYPPEDELDGFTIGIDPVPPEDSCAVADPAMVTAAYLYHHLRRAGASAVLTRSERPLHKRDVERCAELLRENRCNVFVSIEYVDGLPAIAILAASDGANAERSRQLVTHLDDALPGDISAAESGKQASLVSRLASESQLPGCLVRFPWPQGDARPLASGPVYQRNARALYDGIRDLLKPKQDAENVKTEPPDKGDGLIVEQRGKTARRARRIWPDGRLPDAKLDWFCRMFRSTSITNQSLVYFDVSAEPKGHSVILRGATNTPSVVDGLAGALRAVGRDVVERDIRVLPDDKRLGQRRFGVTRVTSALTFNAPSERAGLQTQLLFGEPVYLLDASGDYYLAHAGDGYWGWVRTEAIETMTADQFHAYMRLPRAAVLRNHHDGASIPRGAVLPAPRTGDDVCEVLLPDGKREELPAGAVRIDDTHANRVERQVLMALDLLYVPYLFGGRSPFGLDCSGLITNLCARDLEDVSRDAWHQVFSGTLSATRWHRGELRAGDFVYFIDPAGRVYHAGIAISPTHILHSAPPGVQIGSFDRADRLYDKRIDRDFFMAKRR